METRKPFHTLTFSLKAKRNKFFSFSVWVANFLLVVSLGVVEGLRYFQGKGSAPIILFTYNQMKTNGYVLYQDIPVTLPANWTSTLSDYNQIHINRR